MPPLSRLRLAQVVAILSVASVFACGEGEGSEGTGGQGAPGGATTGGTGGRATGGSATGGQPTGGASSTGGAGGAPLATGGGKTGGAAGSSPGTGGSRTGGAGGTATGGGNGGSAATGGAAGGDPALAYRGRFDLTDPTKPTFSWSGSSVVARFQGTGATLHIDGSPNDFTVVVDGVAKPDVLHVVAGTTNYLVASGLSNAMHEVIVARRTEGNQGDNRVTGLDVAGGALLAPASPPAHRLEIYGDSITAGYGMDGQGPTCAASAANENHYLTYGALTARMLNAELHTVAWSGMGMYRNYNEAGPSTQTMPTVYARTLASRAESTWDFATWQPQAVVINLGTNDASTMGDPGMPYRMAYLSFVRALRQRYPSAFIVLSIGPMLDGANLTAIRGHLQAVIQTRQGEGDTKMSYLEFPVQVQSDGYGCDYHPSPATNAKMAALLVTELKKQLGW